METMTERYGVISIHSSHTGRDVILLQAAETSTKFQSTLPIREETLTNRAWSPYVVRFQSTLPIREETLSEMDGKIDRNISIHSSHTGRDHFFV